MLNFGKNKNNQTVKRRRYSYDLPAAVDEPIADVLLTEESDALLKASLLRQDINTKPESISAESVTEESILTNEAPRQEKFLFTRNDFAATLEKSKKLMTTHYAVIGVACFALFLGICSTLIVLNMQRDVQDLRSLTASLTTQINTDKKNAAVKAAEIDQQIVQLNEKVDKIFEVDNMDNVLQVTRELKKQIHSLANKNLNLTNSHSTPAKESSKSSKSVSSKPKANVEKPVTEKSVSTSKTDSVKKALKDKKNTKHETTGKTVKHKPATQTHVEKPATSHLPALPKLDDGKTN